MSALVGGAAYMVASSSRAHFGCRDLVRKAVGIVVRTGGDMHARDAEILYHCFSWGMCQAPVDQLQHCHSESDPHWQ